MAMALPNEAAASLRRVAGLQGCRAVAGWLQGCSRRARRRLERPIEDDPPTGPPRRLERRRGGERGAHLDAQGGSWWCASL